MSFYSKIYYTLCDSRKQEFAKYKKGSNLHKHHIIPKHKNGTDDDHNITYLTIREHMIAHYLLWKINGDANDLRSMKMLGANITTSHRKIIGEYCRDNNLGFFSDKFTTEHKKEWRKLGITTQKKHQIGIYNPDNRSEYASIGGIASIKSTNNPWSYWASKEGQRHRASLGGKSHIGKKAMYIPGDNTFIRVSPDDIQKYLDKGYIFGSPISPVKGKNFGPSVRRRKVSDGKIIYESVHDAAEKNNITPGGIVYRCQSKKSTWHYVSDT